MKRIMFVCTGNICRSPSAEAVLRFLSYGRGVQGAVEIESSGTHGYHVGEPSDPRAIDAAIMRGIDMQGIRAQKFAKSDFDKFDLVLAMDRGHYKMLEAIKPKRAEGQLVLFSDYLQGNVKDVPDPYYGGDEGFEVVLDMLEEGCGAILDSLEL